jgi:mannose-1-phosphate guanylyltransferase
MPEPTFVLIMAGGVGSRFWPASREHLPKQFLDITGEGKTLIQMTFERFAAFIPVENIFIITHDKYKEQTLEAVPEMNAANIITEPSRNNTAASIALASLKLTRHEPEAVCIVAPSDHVIRNESEFERVTQLAVDHARNNHSIVTLGIAPSRPDTGYGYIEFEKGDVNEIRKVKSFREKPDNVKASEYLQAGNFAWNSGIFVWRLDNIIEAFKKHSTQIYDILIEGQELYNTTEESEFVKREYPRTEKISVDFAILEKADNVFTIPCDIGWSDLGTWNSLYDQSRKDEHNNALLSKLIHVEDANNSLVIANNSKLIVIKGLEDFIIVDTDDCLMIYPKSEEQNIKALKEKLKDQGLDDYL